MDHRQHYRNAAMVVQMNTKRNKPGVKVVKSMRKSHAAIGLTWAMLLYLVCLSGTLAVFFEEFERWEQPTIPEYPDYTPDSIERATDMFLAQADTPPKTLYVVLPSTAMPRMHVSGDDTEFYLAADGTLTDPPAQGWTHFLLHLHNHLLLPETAGLLITGSLGVILCGLIVTGLLAHPSLLKDLFRFRNQRSDRLRELDLHNRLGVWGAPFYLMMGMTGAFFGLVGVLIAAGAWLWTDNDRDALIAAVYGEDIQIVTSEKKIDYRSAFANLKTAAPDAQPIYLMLQNPGQDTQYLEIAATLPGRLIYSEIYRFHPDGQLLSHQGLSDGPIGRQVAYSVYRLHFGHFGGFMSKALYAIMGTALTLLCVSGVNIWLARQKDWRLLHLLWPGFVWACPGALAMAAVAALLDFRPAPVFLITLPLLTIATGFMASAARVRQYGKLFLLGCLLSVFATHIGLYAEYSWRPSAVGINVGLLLLGLIIYGGLLSSFSRSSKKLGPARPLS